MKYVGVPWKLDNNGNLANTLTHQADKTLAHLINIQEPKMTI